MAAGVEFGGMSTRHWPMLVRIRMIMVELLRDVDVLVGNGGGEMSQSPRYFTYANNKL